MTNQLSVISVPIWSQHSVYKVALLLSGTLLTGVNGAGKTTQLQIVMGRLQPDTGEVVKAKRNMRIAYLAQVGGGRSLVVHSCNY
jgi:ABC-type Mn2+/Zn2+ transport system ATPase subunit